MSFHVYNINLNNYMYLFTLQKDNIRISDIMGCLQTKKNRMREGGGASMKQESENFFGAKIWRRNKVKKRRIYYPSMVNLSLEHCGRTSDLIYKLAWRPAQEISLFAHLSFSRHPTSCCVLLQFRSVQQLLS